MAAFATVGARLLARVEALAHATRGRFDGEAAVALETARLYTAAAANGLLAYAAQTSLPEEEKLAAATLGHGFRRALGVLATHFPGGAHLPSLASLDAPEARLADRFVAAPPVVTVDAPAADALDVLRRDTLSLDVLPPEELLALMRAASAGTAVP